MIDSTERSHLFTVQYIPSVVAALIVNVTWVRMCYSDREFRASDSWLIESAENRSMPTNYEDFLPLGHTMIDLLD